MSLTAEQTRAIAEFPLVLQSLIHAELAAGNSIIEIGSGFPAPPVGACLRLGKKVTTRPRESDGQISFYDRNNSSYSGEFTDAKRFFFVLEPPNDPEPYPDMDAIRAEMEARQRAADAELITAAEREAFEAAMRAHFSKTSQDDDSKSSIPNASPLVSRFLESMVMNYERWHDGIGYDLAVLDEASPDERQQIEDLLLSRTLDDWRDVEALAAFDTPRSREKIRRAFGTTDPLNRINLIAHAKHLFTDSERTEVLVSALRDVSQSPMLTRVMMEVQEFHPHLVIEALLDGVRIRDGATAGSFAMMLLFIHGKATSPYDMSQRPFILRFQSENRDVLIHELAERLKLH